MTGNKRMIVSSTVEFKSDAFTILPLHGSTNKMLVTGGKDGKELQFLDTKTETRTKVFEAPRGILCFANISFALSGWLPAV